MSPTHLKQAPFKTESRKQRGLRCLAIAALLSPIFLLTGCAMLAVPIPAGKREAISGQVIDKADVAFISVGVTTRDEVVQKLGQNFRTRGSGAPISYSWEKKGGDIYYAGLIASYGGAAAGAGKDSRTWSSWRGLFVEFDATNRVRRFEFLKLKLSQSVDEQRDQWEAKGQSKSNQRAK